MKVVGFTIIRNAIIYDFPIKEAILSVLPLCDSFVVAVGKSDDDTLNYIRNINSNKIKIIETEWNLSLREGGQVLAEETNKAYDAIPEDADWCFYIQGDEVIHEKDYPAIQDAMQKNIYDKKAEGLLFKYKHFYGSYDYIADSRKWYRHEIRIIRKDPLIRSYKDAQGFRKDGKKLRVREIDAHVHHYGWVKHPDHQKAKRHEFVKLWHDDDYAKKNEPVDLPFDYSQIDSLRIFKGEHPKVMQERVRKINWRFAYDPTQRKLGIKERASRWWESITGIRIGEYKNYIKL